MWLVTIGRHLNTKVIQTFVNGKLVYDHGQFNEDSFGMAIDFLIKKSNNYFVKDIAKAIEILNNVI
jgi:cytochrome c-type biogenesis protein CcmE